MRNSPHDVHRYFLFIIQKIMRWWMWWKGQQEVLDPPLVAPDLQVWLWGDREPLDPSVIVEIPERAVAMLLQYRESHSDLCSHWRAGQVDDRYPCYNSRLILVSQFKCQVLCSVHICSSALILIENRCPPVCSQGNTVFVIAYQELGSTDSFVFHRWNELWKV